MTEKQKMLAGKMYFAGDKELTDDRLRAKELIYNFNMSKPADTELRINILKQLVVLKSNAVIEAPFYCDYGYNIELSDNFFANFNCIILDVNKVKIGSNVLFAPNVQIYTAAHPTDPAERLTFKEYSKPITIGDNVWLGGGVIVCPGVTIGSNTTIGAGSVVTKDIPSNVIAAGNPCKVIRTV